MPEDVKLLSRPVPIQVRIRKLEDKRLPRKLAPRGIEFRWSCSWDEAVAEVTEAPAMPVVTEAPLEQRAEVELEAPRFGLGAESSAGKRIGPAVAIALMLAAGTVWTLTDRPSSAAGGRATQPNSLAGLSSALSLGPTAWRAEPAADARGMAAGRRLTLYRPSLRLSDYAVDFSGQIQSRSLGWVFRFADPKNYYAARIEVVRPGLMPELALARYAVIDGEEVSVSRVPVRVVLRSDVPYRIRFEARGPRFTTYIQGRAVDLWNDTRLRQGAFGFMNDREARAEIKSVQFSMPVGTTGR